MPLRETKCTIALVLEYGVQVAFKSPFSRHDIEKQFADKLKDNFRIESGNDTNEVTLIPFNRILLMSCQEFHGNLPVSKGPEPSKLVKLN